MIRTSRVALALTGSLALVVLAAGVPAVASAPATARGTAPTAAVATTSPSAKAAKKPPRPTGRLFVWASVSPDHYLADAVVTVRDKHGHLVAAGHTNARGIMRLQLRAGKGTDRWVQLRTEGGTVGGEPFKGHLEGYAYTRGDGSDVAFLDLVTSAAARIRKSGDERREWAESVRDVRRALGIRSDRRADVLRTRNNYVDHGKLAAILASGPKMTYDQLVGKIAKAAKKHKRFTGLAPDRWTPTPVAQAPVTRAVATTSDTASSPCSAPLPNSSAPGMSSTELIENLGIAGIGGLMDVAGFPATANTVVAGIMLMSMGSGGPSPDQAELEAINQQLDCISSQINALQVQANNAALATAMAPAQTCANSLAEPWLDYNALVAAAEPQSVSGVTGSAGYSTVLLPGTSWSSIQPGYTVTGPGIGVNTQVVAGASAPIGSTVVQFPGTLTNIIAGMTVAGSGIGVNSDNSPVTVLSVTPAGGSTTVVISAPTTAAISGSLTFTIGATVASLTALANGTTQLVLTAPNSGPVSGTLTVAYLLNLANSDLAYDASLWGPLKSTCGASVNNSLFVPATPGVRSGWQQMVYNLTTNSGASAATGWLTQAQSQQLQQFLAYWGMIEYEQMVLTNEYNNYYNLMTTAAAEAGGVEGVPGLCATGTTATSATYCAYQSNLANASPGDLYSDEVGLIAGGVGVQPIPGGYGIAPCAITSIAFSAPSTVTVTLPSDCLGQMAASRVTIAGATSPGNNGTFTATYGSSLSQLVLTNPNGAVQAGAAGTIRPDLQLGMNDLWGSYYANSWYQNAFFERGMQQINSQPIATSSTLPSAVESFTQLRAYHTVPVTGSAANALNTPALSGATGVQSLLNGLNQDPTSEFTGIPAGQVGFVGADAQATYSISITGCGSNCSVATATINWSANVPSLGSTYYYNQSTGTSGQLNWPTYPYINLLAGRSWWPDASLATTYVPPNPKTSASPANYTALTKAPAAPTPWSSTSPAPWLYWKLDETGGNYSMNAADSSGNGHIGYINFTGGTYGVTGALTSSSNTPNLAVTMPGNTTTACVYSNFTPAVAVPTTLTESVWFKTTTTAGGKLMGFESAQTNEATYQTYDRHIYMDGSGVLWFGVWNNNAPQAVSSGATYNDGQWHLANATFGSHGTSLYLDGVQVSHSANTAAQATTGWLRAGCGNLAGWGSYAWTGGNNPGATNTAGGTISNRPFAGSLDEVTLWNSELTPSQILALYEAR